MLEEGLVGYWYGGEGDPAKIGEEIVLSRDLNVRADYPDSHNRHNRHAEVLCVLLKGQRVRLSRDPIGVSKGHHWVPLAGSDVL